MALSHPQIANLPGELRGPQRKRDDRDFDRQRGPALPRNQRHGGDEEDLEKLQDGFGGAPRQTGKRHNLGEIDGERDEHEAGKRGSSAGLDSEKRAPLRHRHADYFPECLPDCDTEALGALAIICLITSASFV